MIILRLPNEPSCGNQVEVAEIETGDAVLPVETKVEYKNETVRFFNDALELAQFYKANKNWHGYRSAIHAQSIIEEFFFNNYDFDVQDEELEELVHGNE